jgi:hypothetical protein
VYTVDKRLPDTNGASKQEGPKNRETVLKCVKNTGTAKKDE